MPNVFKKSDKTPEAALWFFAGHDPSGGAGIQADIEVAAAFDLPAVSVITATTVQNSQGVIAVEPLPATWLAAQLEGLLKDFPPPKGIKISVVGSRENLQVIVDFLEKLAAPCPVVFDPILRAGSHGDLQSALASALVAELLPKVTLLTPNLPELLTLAALSETETATAQTAATTETETATEDSEKVTKKTAIKKTTDAEKITKKNPNEHAMREAIATLQGRGIKGIFVSGGHHGAEDILVNRLFWQDLGEVGRWNWPRLTGDFHGSGCTLAAALLCALSKQSAPWPVAMAAWQDAQTFTYQSLQTARVLGKNQHYPRRHKI